MSGADLSEARRLLGAGMHLVELIPYTKQPAGEDWNHRRVVEINPHATGYGLLLAPNKLCSVDPDNLDQARQGLAALGFDLEQIMEAGVRTRSTRPGSGGRSTFAAEGDLCWLKFSSPTGTAIEFRAESPNLQDCVPGVVYRDKAGRLCRQEYANCRRLDDAPSIPDELLAWWERCSRDVDFLREQQRRFFEAIGVAPHLAISTGKGSKLAFDAPGIRTAYNARHDVESLLDRHGYSYDRRTQRWAPPSASGAAGVRPIPGKAGLWRSDHASDPLHGTFDAWTAHVVLDHQGNLEAALAAARAEGIGSTPEPPDDDRFAPIDVIAGPGSSNEPPRGKQSGLPYRWAGQTIVRRTPDYVVKHLLGRARQATCIAEPGVGKTFLMFRLACHGTAGRPWYGHRVQKGAWLWLGLEGEAGLELRTAAHLKAGVLEKDAPLALVTVSVSLLTQSDAIVETALAAAKERDERPSVVVVDTLSRALAGHDENASETMTAAVRAGDDIRAATGASVVFVHHPSKNGTGAGRGHSSLYGAVDLEMHLARSGDDRRAIVKKNRDGQEGAEYPFRLEVVELGTDTEGDSITSCTAVPTDAAPLRVLAARSENQRAILKRLRAWIGKRSDDQLHLSTEELHELFKDVGVTQRQRRFDLAEWLIGGGALTRSVAGYVLHVGVIK